METTCTIALDGRRVKSDLSMTPLNTAAVSKCGPSFGFVGLSCVPKVITNGTLGLWGHGFFYFWSVWDQARALKTFRSQLQNVLLVFHKKKKKSLFS